MFWVLGLQLSLLVQQSALPANIVVKYIDVNTVISQSISAAAAVGVVTTTSCVSTVPPFQPPWYGLLLPNVTASACKNATGYF